MKKNYIIYSLAFSSLSIPISAQESGIEKSTEAEDVVFEYWNERIQKQAAEKIFPSTGSGYRHKTVSKAPKDGCYYEIGSSKNSYIPKGMSLPQCAECEADGGKLKSNQSYIWGLTQGNGQIYFGINANYMCIQMSELTQGNLGPALPPYDNDCWVCEYEKSSYKDPYGNMWGDWKAPRIYHYNPETGITEDVTPEDQTVMNNVYGLRAAGSLNEVSFVAGPNKRYGGVSFFAYNNKTNEYLGALNMNKIPGFDDIIPSNIRRSVVIDGVLYFGLEYRYKNKTAGALIRWNGDASNPFNFSVVGWMPKGASEFAVLKNRLYVGTWPMAICRGPEIPVGGFQEVTNGPSEQSEWEVVFDYNSYEPDAAQAQFTMGGAMTVFNDYIYFGSLHLQWANIFIAQSLYGVDIQKDPIGYLKAIAGSYRSCELFRLSETETPVSEDNSNSSQINSGCKIELLYGEEKLPAYNYQLKKWEVKETGWKPLFGKSGFGNMFNNYVWSSAIYDNKLFIGTMDYSNIVIPIFQSVMDSIAGPMSDAVQNFITGMKDITTNYGFDFGYIENPTTRIKFLSQNGLKNPAAYGIRNFVNVGDKLYLGTASPLNLHEQSGWELIEFKKGTPFKETKLVWNPTAMTYGEPIGENQLNAKVMDNNVEVPGKFSYTYQMSPIDNTTIACPESIKVRLEFVPNDNVLYEKVNSTAMIKVNKAPLSVVAPDLKIEKGNSIPDEYELIFDGFVYKDTPESLDKKPTWETIQREDDETKSTIHISGGESTKYAFNYTDGTLEITVPTNIREKTSDFNIYPVPFKDAIQFRSEQSILKVEILAMDGSLVLSKENPGLSINVSQLPATTYLIKITTADGTIVRKIAKL